MPTPTKLLTFKADENVFIGELSTCPLVRIMGLQHGRLVSAGYGLELISDKTARIATFLKADEDRDPEGELMAVYLAPTQETVKALPQLKDTRIILFND